MYVFFNELDWRRGETGSCICDWIVASWVLAAPRRAVAALSSCWPSAPTPAQFQIETFHESESMCYSFDDLNPFKIFTRTWECCLQVN